MNDEMLYGLYELVYPMLTLVVGAYLLPKLKKWIAAKIDGEKETYLEKVVLRATDAAYTAVKEVGQTFADSLKASRASDSDGGSKLTDEEKRMAQEKAKARMKEMVGAEGLSMLAGVLGSEGLESFLTSKIEAAVKDTKNP